MTLADRTKTFTIDDHSFEVTAKEKGRSNGYILFDIHVVWKKGGILEKITDLETYHSLGFTHPDWAVTIGYHEFARLHTNEWQIYEHAMNEWSKLLLIQRSIAQNN